MSRRNEAFVDFNCPHCHRWSQSGFVISEGSQHAERIGVGEMLPWRFNLTDPPPEPQGRWWAKGTGHCEHCSQYLDGIVVFDGLKLVEVKGVQVSTKTQACRPREL